MEATEEDIRQPGSGAINIDSRDGLAKQKHRFEDPNWVAKNFKCSSSRIFKLNHIITLLKGSSQGQ